MLEFRDRRIIFNVSRCMQCGGCLAACEKGALTYTIKSNGLYSLHVNEKDCNHCVRCVAVCPAPRLFNNRLSEGSWEQILESVLTYAKDDRIRRMASSGGTARMILVGALEMGLVEKAYTLKHISEYPWAEGTLWSGTVAPDIIPGSMYLPVMAMKNLRPPLSAKSILLIGTSCQLLAATHLLKGQVERIIQVAILCKQQKMFAATQFMARRLGLRIDMSGNHAIRYRGGGWPGEIMIDNRSMSYDAAAALPFGKRLWRIPGCLCCPNPLGINVDLTLADPWGIDGPGSLGKTMALVWTDHGRHLLESNKNVVVEQGISIDAVKHSIDWEGLQVRQQLVDYYAGIEVPIRVKCIGLAEKYQTGILEKILETVQLPKAAYKILAHLPDATSLFIRRAH
jgi:coenzyme F420-reducing hydrogenase beta subunit